MTYPQTIDYLYKRLPMFTRVGSAALKPGLGNIVQFSEHLGNPHNQFKTIHIAGTNGKGSTSHMLAAIFQQAGYKTGLYTSPHLKDFRERIRINGKMAPKKYITNFVEKHKSYIEKLDPSFFEVTVGMAFQLFAEEKVDIAIIEVGLGGRLDSTNIILPELSIITNISLDHTYLLGETTRAIAMEKAGIIKKDVPVVIGEYAIETEKVFVEKANSLNSPFLFADKLYKANRLKDQGSYLVADIYKEDKILFKALKLDLTGNYQLNNVLTVIAAIQKIQEIGFVITGKHIRLALKNVKKHTGLLGRWQTIHTNPLAICDTGHNEAGIKEVLTNIKMQEFNKLHFVIGMVNDKDISKILSMLPNNACYYFCAPALERALSAMALSLQGEKHGLKGSVYESVSEAYKNALENATINDLVFVGGSTFVVAEIL